MRTKTLKNRSVRTNLFFNSNAESAHDPRKSATHRICRDKLAHPELKLRETVSSVGTVPAAESFRSEEPKRAPKGAELAAHLSGLQCVVSRGRAPLERRRQLFKRAERFKRPQCQKWSWLNMSKDRAAPNCPGDSSVVNSAASC